MGGAYLSRPVTEKVSEVGKNSQVSYGVSSMQGWRMKQEDAHSCLVDFDENTSLFAVYDGHGGSEVAKYTSENFPNFLRNNEKYESQDYSEALVEAFLGFDDTIPTPVVMNVLKKIVKAEDGESEYEESSEQGVVKNSSQAGCSSHSDECDQDLETPESLRADANKPIEEVMASYRIPNINKVKFETSKPASPYLRGRRGVNNGISDGAACASNAGCSSSTMKSTTDTVADSEPISKEDESDDSNSRVIPIEKSDKDTTSGCSSEAGKSDNPAIVNGAVNGSVNEEVENTVKRSKRISAGSASSENSTSCGTPGTSPKKTKKLALDDLDDSAVIKNFITNDEIADDDEEDSEDETFQPTDETPDSDDDCGEDDYQLSKRTLAKHFLKCFDKAVRNSYDIDEDGDESEDDSTDEGDSSAHSEDVADEAEENVIDEQEDENSEEESAEDSDEDDMACRMLPTMGDEKPGVDSGCTAVVALLKGRDLYVANAGDSRCVVCKSGKAVDMSEDHKPEDQMERNRIVKAGGYVTMDGRVNGGLNLSRAIGDHCYKQNTDLPNTEQMITALPDVRTIKLEPDVEFLVLACDGIWNSMTSQEVVDFVRPKILENKSLSEICEELFDKCLAPDTWGDGTGCDNMTCIIVKPTHGTGETPSVESNTTEKSGLETSEVDAAGDACSLNKSEKVASETLLENGVAKADDTTKKNEAVSANGDEQPTNSQFGDDSTTTVAPQSKAQKRCANEMVADDDHNKRQKTDDTKVELN